MYGIHNVLIIFIQIKFTWSIQLPISSKTAHNFPSFQTDLNSLISPFSNCLIILHEFSPIFIGVIKHPVILTNFYEKERHNLKTILKANFHGERSKPFTNYTFRANPQPIYLNCLVEFFFDYPLEDYLVVWNSYQAFINVNRPDIGHMFMFHLPTFTTIQKYRILVTSEADPKKWDQWLYASVALRSAQADMIDRMVYHVGSSGLEIQVNLICEYCSKSSHTYEHYNGSFNLLDLNKAFTEINNVNNGVSWHLTNYQVKQIEWKERVDKMAQYFKSDGLTFRNYQPWMNFEYIMLNMITPNSSINDTIYQRLGVCSSNHVDKKDPLYIFKISTQCRKQRIAIPAMQIGVQFAPQYYAVYSEDRIKFMTCDGHQLSYDMNGFISSFQLATWICIFLMAIMIPVALQLGLRLKGHQGNETMDIYLMPWHILLEQGDKIAQNNWKEPFAYWICSTWLLMSIIISNAYKGQNVTQLTSPLEPDVITTFQELAKTDFKIYNQPSSEQGIINILNAMRFIIDPDTWTEGIGRWSLTEIGMKIRGWERYMPKNDKNGAAFQKIWNIVIRFQIPLNIADIIYFNNGSYVDAVSDCNKTALAMWKDDLDMSYYELKKRRPDRLVSRGEEELLITTRGFIIRDWVDPNILTKIAVLLHSGLSSQWQKVIRNSRLIPALINGTNYQSSWSKLSLQDNTVVVFYAYGIAFGILCLIFFFEIVLRLAFSK